MLGLSVLMKEEKQYRVERSQGSRDVLVLCRCVSEQTAPGPLKVRLPVSPVVRSSALTLYLRRT